MAENPTTNEPSPRAAGRFTWDDYVCLPDDDRRELIDGELVEPEMPTILHEWIVSLLVTALMNWALPRRAGVVVASGYKVKVSARRAVMPDVQFFRRAQVASLPAQGLDTGRPEIAIEVISPSSVGRDRVTKLEYYASLGVPEYWIVHPEERTFERLVLREGRYLIADALQGDAVFRPPELEGLEIPLGPLWTLPAGD